MTTYSHSRISTFENCPYQYKLKYIDREKPEIENTIEAFMGSIVHEALEDLYKRVKFKKRIAKASLIKFYRDLWDKHFSKDIKIVKEGLTSENYKKMGEKFLSDYFEKYKPFDQLTILGLETQDRMTLPDGNSWHVRIDKLACDNKGNYYVMDYKTNSRMKDQEEADADRQLALYSVWVKDKFQDAKSVKLVWHMLAFNKEVISERTDEELKKLQQDIVNTIKKIENTKEFPTNVTALCNYCGYKHLCPSFRHKQELEEKETVREFKDDEGLKIVDELAEVQKKKKEIKETEEKLKTNLAEFAKQKNINVIYGSNMKARVKEFDKIEITADNKEELINLLKKKGLYDNYSMLCSARFNSHVVKGQLKDADIEKLIEIVKGFKVGLSKREDLEGEDE